MRFSTLLFFLPLVTLSNVAGAQNSRQDFVDCHNAARAEVGVGPVAWSHALAAYAESYAYERAGDCQLIHSQGPYGENIFEGTGDYTATFAVQDWVSEKQYYDYHSNSCAEGEMCGHYTQVVWRDTTSVGCARVPCAGGGVFVVCSYYPPGNVVGERPY